MRFVFPSILCFHLMLSCSSVWAIQNSQSHSRPSTPNEFVSAFEHAFHAASKDEALALFHWSGVSQTQRAAVVEMIERDLRLDLLDVKRLPLGSGPTAFASESQRFEPNITLVGHLLARFKDANGVEHYSMHMIGVASGFFYIALAVPVGSAGHSALLDRPIRWSV